MTRSLFKTIKPFCLSLLWKVPWSLLPMGTPIIRIPKRLSGPAFGIPVLVGQKKDRQNAWAGGGDACQRGLQGLEETDHAAPRARHLCKLQEAERSPAELMETPHARGSRRQSHTETKAGRGACIYACVHTRPHSIREMNRGRLIPEGSSKRLRGKKKYYDLENYPLQKCLKECD